MYTWKYKGEKWMKMWFGQRDGEFWQGEFVLQRYGLKRGMDFGEFIGMEI